MKHAMTNTTLAWLKIRRKQLYLLVTWVQKRTNNTVGQHRSCDTLPRAPNPLILLPIASDIDSITDAFHVLFPIEMVELIVKHTNTKIQHVLNNLPEHRLRSCFYIRLLTHCEIYAFIGLLYARGLLTQSLHENSILFSETTGHPIFGATMSRHRFTFLDSILLFDKRITEVTANDDVGGYARYAETRKRCIICEQNLSGNNLRLKRSNLNKMKTQCKKCGTIVCDAHSKLLVKSTSKFFICWVPHAFYFWFQYFFHCYTMFFNSYRDICFVKNMFLSSNTRKFTIASTFFVIMT